MEKVHAGYWTIFLILGLFAVVSVVVASLPLRSVWLRVAVLVGHVVLSVVLIASPDGPRPLWVMVFGPGLLVALVRLSISAYRGIRGFTTPANDG
jgi:energy-coupling factor transporter transmembrane protein EcfT